MEQTRRYVLDASVLIQAARGYYAFDIAPTFWEKLADLFEQGLVISIDQVKAEIDRGKDNLKDWTDSLLLNVFESTETLEILQAYGQVITWANSQPKYSSSAKAELARKENADAWVVAFAIAHGCIVVSQETSAPQSETKIKMPDVCRAFGVECITTFEMLRRLKVTL